MLLGTGATAGVCLAPSQSAHRLGRYVPVWAPVVVAVFPLLVVYPLALASENLLIPLLTLTLAPRTGHFVDCVTTRKLGVGAGAGLGHLGRALWP